ncbi:MAG: endoglucanase [Urechidicola sp.]|jgi:endoglucanase|tara:strand:+ start:4230 stop:6089 length:1860 start_codon:yes stop_codon:yes gene_type:complete
MKYLLYIILFAFISLETIAQITPQQMVSKMGRGINLGNVMSAPEEGDWAPEFQETYFQDVADAGFTTVRIPIRFDTQTTPLSSVTYTDGNGDYIGSPSDYNVNTSYLDRIELITGWAISKDMVAIIDVHGDHWYWESYDSGSDYYKTGNDRLAAEDRFRAIWIAISNRFQNKSEDLLFEIMNEAYFSMSASEVDIVNADILSIIRQTNLTRNVIVNGGGLGSWEAPLQMSPSFINSDPYLIATFHYYKPFSFTSSSKEQYNDFDWGTPMDKTSIDTHFDAVLELSETYDIPILLGEFGADNEGGYNYFNETYGAFGGPDNASRVAYHKYLAEGAISRGFAFTAWDAGEKSNKAIYKVSDRTWVEDVRDALLGTTATCTTSGIILNADVECGFDQDWNFLVQTPAAATNSASGVLDANNGGIAMQIDVTVSDALHKVLLRNVEVTDSALAEKTFTFSLYAKGSANTEEFKIRLKATDNVGEESFNASPIFTLTSSYQLFEFEYTVAANTSSLEFQIICGNKTGTYYFDDFSVTEETLSISDFNAENKIVVYPNPASNYITINAQENIKKIELYDIKGMSYKINLTNNSIKLPNVDNGIYFIKIIFNNNKTRYKKLLIHNN